MGLHGANGHAPAYGKRHFFQDQKALYKAAVAYVQAASVQLPLAQKAASRPYCDFKRNWSLGYRLIFSEYSDMHRLVRLLALHALVLNQQGKPLQALDQIAIGAHVAQHVGQDDVVISRLVQIALENIVHNIWVRVVQSHTLNPTVLRKAAEVNRAFGPLPDMASSLRGEVAMISDLHKGLQSSPAQIQSLLNSLGTSSSIAEPFWVKLWKRIAGKEPQNHITSGDADLLVAHTLLYYYHVYTANRHYQTNLLDAYKAVAASMTV